MRRGAPREPEFTLVARGNAIVERDGALAVSCWCERRILLVPRPIVLSGRTGSCGHRQCEYPMMGAGAR